MKNCEICSKLTIKTPERRQWRSGVFIVNFEYIWTYFTPFSRVSIVDFKQVTYTKLILIKFPKKLENTPWTIPFFFLIIKVFESQCRKLYLILEGTNLAWSNDHVVVKIQKPSLKTQ